MAGLIKTIIEAIREGLDQLVQEPMGPPQKRQVPRRAPAKRVPVNPPPSHSPSSFESPFSLKPENVIDLVREQHNPQTSPVADLKQSAPLKKPTSVVKSESAIKAHELLRSPGGARQAIILSEILNRPEHRWKK